LDPFSITITDPDYGNAEERLITIGVSARQRLLVVIHTMRGRRIRIISARKATNNENTSTKKSLSKSARTGEMRPEYDFSGGVRGKYAAAWRRGTNVVLLDADVARAFPDSRSVNDALRALLTIATRAPKRRQS
jgi:hypothetical protein